MFEIYIKTATTLHNLIYELGKHQKIQNEIYIEMKSACALNEPVTEKTLTKLPLLKASVKEVLRLDKL